MPKRPADESFPRPNDHLNRIEFRNGLQNGAFLAACNASLFAIDRRFLELGLIWRLAAGGRPALPRGGPDPKCGREKLIASFRYLAVPQRRWKGKGKVISIPCWASLNGWLSPNHP